MPTPATRPGTPIGPTPGRSAVGIGPARNSARHSAQTASWPRTPCLCSILAPARDAPDPSLIIPPPRRLIRPIERPYYTFIGWRTHKVQPIIALSQLALQRTPDPDVDTPRLVTRLSNQGSLSLVAKWPSGAARVYRDSGTRVQFPRPPLTDQLQRAASGILYCTCGISCSKGGGGQLPAALIGFRPFGSRHQHPGKQGFRRCSWNNGGR